jgi:hypothetical protein
MYSFSRNGEPPIELSEASRFARSFQVGNARQRRENRTTVTPPLQITPENVRNSAETVANEGFQVAFQVLPDTEAAKAGLVGFATAARLDEARQAIARSLAVVSSRFDEMQQLLRRAADEYEHTDHANARRVSLADRASTALSSLGEMNSAR